MYLRKYGIALMMLSALLIVSGCGGGEGGSAELKTSHVTASVTTANLDSDVKTIAGGVPPADSVDVQVVSTTFPNPGTTRLDLRVNSATISYTPANADTPPLATITQAMGNILSNGGSLSVPVRVVTQEQKILFFNAFDGNSKIYNYNTNITLHISEIGTGASVSVQTATQVRISNFVDR